MCLGRLKWCIIYRSVYDEPVLHHCDEINLAIIYNLIIVWIWFVSILSRSFASLFVGKLVYSFLFFLLCLFLVFISFLVTFLLPWWNTMTESNWERKTGRGLFGFACSVALHVLRLCMFCVIVFCGMLRHKFKLGRYP